jgi:hypothetical protein
MSWEGIALGALCVSQALMWARQPSMWRRMYEAAAADVRRHEREMQALNAIGDRQCHMRDALALALAALPRKRKSRAALNRTDTVHEASP